VSEQLTLGNTITHKGRQYRVVRVIDHSQTLFEEEDGKTFVEDTSYLELKGEDGDVDFIFLVQAVKPYEGPSSVIKGLAPFNL